MYSPNSENVLNLLGETWHFKQNNCATIVGRPFHTFVIPFPHAPSKSKPYCQFRMAYVSGIKRGDYYILEVESTRQFPINTNTSRDAWLLFHPSENYIFLNRIKPNGSLKKVKHPRNKSGYLYSTFCHTAQSENKRTYINLNTRHRPFKVKEHVNWISFTTENVLGVLVYERFVLPSSF